MVRADTVDGPCLHTFLWLPLCRGGNMVVLPGSTGGGAGALFLPVKQKYVLFSLGTC